MKTWMLGSLTVAAASLCYQGIVSAQEIPVPEQPPIVEEAPMPSDGTFSGEGVLYDPTAGPITAPLGDVPPIPAPGCDPLTPPPIAAMHPHPLYCPQPMHGMVSMGCPTTPIYPNAGLCCLSPVQTTSAFCPPPVNPIGPWCPPAAVGVPLATAPIYPQPTYTGFVAGYPFSTAPVYANSCSTRFSAHPLRKDAFWHASPGNMFPQPPITPIAKGNYYFYPYNFRQVQIDQMHAALWTGNTSEPYTAPLLPALATKLQHYKSSLDRALLPSLGNPNIAAPGSLAPLTPSAQ
ncbi:MAG: hypothetical protein RLZZ458_356 [Planctomycetota bacterium]